jgi:hypothetical protein
MLITGQDVLDLKAYALNHGSTVANKIGHSIAAFLMPDPREDAVITRNPPIEVWCTESSDLLGRRVAGNSMEELRGELAKVFGVHGLRYGDIGQFDERASNRRPRLT